MEKERRMEQKNKEETSWKASTALLTVKWTQETKRHYWTITRRKWASELSSFNLPKNRSRTCMNAPKGRRQSALLKDMQTNRILMCCILIGNQIVRYMDHAFLHRSKRPFNIQENYASFCCCYYYHVQRRLIRTEQCHPLCPTDPTIPQHIYTHNRVIHI